MTAAAGAMAGGFVAGGPMAGGFVVGVDGGVASGKSTLVRALADRLAAAPVPEYPPHPDERPGVEPPADAPSRWQMQRHYLDAEDRRARSLAPQARAVLDRTVVSQAAHVAALGHTGGPDLRLRLADWLDSGRVASGQAASDQGASGQPASGRVVEPDVVVILTGRHDEARARCADRESGPDRLNTAALFVDPAYQEAYDAFLLQLARLLPHRIALFPACPEPQSVLERLLSQSAGRSEPALAGTLATQLRG